MALNEKIKVERDKIAKIIIDNIEKKQGLSWLKDWITNEPRNGANPETKYKGINFLKLAYDMEMKETEDPRYFTYNQAKRCGYQVKKNAKSILCEHWSFVEIKKEKLADGTEVEIEKERAIPIVNTFYLFHASDIIGVPEYVKENKKVLKGKINKIVKRLIETSEAPVDFKGGDRAFYSPSKDKISLPPKKSFKSGEGLLATLLHEIAHSTGHENRLCRSIKNVFGDEDYAKEELIAEFSSVFSQLELGISLKEEHIDNHSAYLKNWIQALKKDSDYLYKAIGLSEKATKYIMDRYDDKKKETLKVPLDKTENVENFSPLAI